MIVALSLLVLAIAWRLTIGMGHRHDFEWIHNFAPLSAIALCGARYLPRRLALALPLVALFITDLVLNAYYSASLLSVEMLARYVALALISAGGWALRRTPRAAATLGASLLGSALFFFLTNTASWITDPGYAKTLAGLGQSLTTGLPGFPPTLTFFRHTLVSDLVFTAIFIAAMAIARRRSAESHAPLAAEPARWA